MDKRKLSAIPPEEATEDMYEMAYRSEGIKYIVTAEQPEKDLLVLNFYGISELKRGKTQSSFRTFLSKSDYITQDMKQKKIKWLTSSFENMSIFAFIWSVEKQEYESRSRLLIRSKKEMDIISRFFEDYKVVKKGEYYHYPLPKPWESVKRFQDDVMRKRLSAKHQKELEKTDREMEPIKQVPDTFIKWMGETGMRFSRYVIYKEIKNGEALCECTHCKNTGLVKRAQVRMRNNEKGACPFCGSPVTFKAKGKLPYQTTDSRWFMYVDPTKDGFVLRYFLFNRTIGNDSFLGNAGLKSTRVTEQCREFSRVVYSFKEGEAEATGYEWGIYKQRGEHRWCPENNRYMTRDSILYPENLPGAWAHTPMKYSAFEVLSANVPTEAMPYEMAIQVYRKFPKLEWINKMGLNQLAKHIIHNMAGRYARGVAKINYKADTIYEILGLTKENVRVLQQIDGGDYELRLLQVAQQAGIRLLPEQLKEYYETFECNTDFLHSDMRKVSIHKVVKYIAKESENYPMGDKAGCWKYAFMRFTEREDPRITRKRNCAHDWLEYLKWCKEMKYDIDNMFIYMPKNFKKVHDRTAGEYQQFKEKKAAAEKKRQETLTKKKLEQMRKAMEELFSKNEGTDAFSIKGKGLVIVVPKNGEEIRKEGERLHHCVGTYVEKVAKGETNIFFVRKAEQPDKSYFTMEYKDGYIVQCRGKNNCAMPPDVKAFVKVFEQKMQEAEQKVSQDENQNGISRKRRKAG